MRHPVRTALAVVLAATAVAAGAAPVLGQTGNLLVNGNFEAGVVTPQSSGPGAGISSALGSWNQYSNSTGTISTWATAPLIEGDHLAEIEGGLNDGLYQYLGVSGTYTLSGWFYVLSGSARLGLAWSSGSEASFGATTSGVGQWEYLSMTVGGLSGLGGALLYGNESGSHFLAEGLWLNAGSTSTSVFDPSRGFAPAAAVPEPGSLVLAGLGLAALGGLRRRRGARAALRPRA